MSYVQHTYQIMARVGKFSSTTVLEIEAGSMQEAITKVRALVPSYWFVRRKMTQPSPRMDITLGAHDYQEVYGQLLR